jgi:hypothetical protein
VEKTGRLQRRLFAYRTVKDWGDWGITAVARGQASLSFLGGRFVAVARALVLGLDVEDESLNSEKPSCLLDMIRSGMIFRVDQILQH